LPETLAATTIPRSRGKAPVFVLGCPRSGTTYLYHALLSAGDFAIFRSESNVFNLLAPRFGGLRSAGDRQALMNVWLKSQQFRVSGLNADEIRKKVVEQCRSGGDFLRLLMEEIARKQGVTRWADCTPDHLLHIPEIKREIPDAVFVHIIRDGRDVALSYAKQGWSHPLPWDRNESLAMAGLYWEWIVRKGQAYGKEIGADYMEVRFEDLVTDPQPTFSRVGAFVGCDLDCERIRRAGIGSVSEPNSSFVDEGGSGFDPVGRWKTKMSREEIAAFEALVGELLRELGYPLAANALNGASFHVARLRATYMTMFGLKAWLKTNTFLGKYVDLGNLQLEER
jgi:hypothetical protein